MDWDEVRKIVIDRYNGEPVPFALQRPLQLLETFFERFADRVPHFFVKIKSPQFGILPVVKKLAEAYRVADRLSYVSHTPQHFLRLRRMSPGASLHNRDFAREETFRLEFPSVLSDVQMFDTVFSPRYHDNPALFDLIRRLRHRGVPSWPYEVSGYDEYAEVFQSGVDGFFSYAPDRSASWMKRLTGTGRPSAAACRGPGRSAGGYAYLRRADPPGRSGHFGSGGRSESGGFQADGVLADGGIRCALLFLDDSAWGFVHHGDAADSGDSRGMSTPMRCCLMMLHTENPCTGEKGPCRDLFFVRG